MLISAVQQLKSAKSHIYCSLFYTFSLFYILMKLCLLFLWIAFIIRQFQKKKKKAIPRVVCCFIFLQGVPGHFPRLTPLPVFFSNEASALGEKKSLCNSHSYTKLPVLLNSPLCLQSEKDMDTRTPTTISNDI